ncbi:MAG: hypothetical protein P4N41_14680 [Negativicutes bacterium]|nr:hypothetical protein [Negativicutes bacterium]
MSNTFRWKFYLDSHGQWRWKRSASAAQAVAYSAGFENKGDCIDNARRSGYVINDESTPLSADPFADVRRPESE